jgi:hypothetical protein
LSWKNPWSLNPCKLVNLIKKISGTVEKYGKLKVFLEFLSKPHFDGQIFKETNVLELLPYPDHGLQAILGNIAEMQLSTNANKNEGIFWLKLGYEYTAKHFPSDTEKFLVFMALFYEGSKDYVRAEGLFRQALKTMEDDKSVSYNMVYCLKSYGNMLKDLEGREKDGAAMLSKAYSLMDGLPGWTNKIDHVLFEEMNI